MTKVFKYTCLDCGREYTTDVYRRPGRLSCTECSMKRCGEAAISMYNKSGPYYENWKLSMKHLAEGL